MSKRNTAHIKDLDMIEESPHPNVISRLKKHIKDVQVKWGPLMAAKEDMFDEYNFPPGRYAGQGIKEHHNAREGVVQALAAVEIVIEGGVEGPPMIMK
ncbi:unnamed protein product [Penicillium camemberti]|uniref:Str. FM013 n=1 Tax=Penicillium camemberti (strain FM 013) TaxID=1429867 RepID=A0A0G4P014_PENC3|nr:unnamed protein product [Penicillium camemberti]